MKGYHVVQLKQQAADLNQFPWPLTKIQHPHDLVHMIAIDSQVLASNPGKKRNTFSTKRIFYYLF